MDYPKETLEVARLSNRVLIEILELLKKNDVPVKPLDFKLKTGLGFDKSRVRKRKRPAAKKVHK